MYQKNNHPTTLKWASIESIITYENTHRLINPKNIKEINDKEGIICNLLNKKIEPTRNAIKTALSTIYKN